MPIPLLLTRILLCTQLRRTYAMQAKPRAEIFSVSGVGDERGSQPIKPAQDFFAQRIDVKHSFEIEDRACAWDDLTRDAHELPGPFTCQLAFKDEYLGIIVSLWQRDS
jgi:hypothetical protein